MSEQNIANSHSLVQHSLGDEVIDQRAGDGYINATAFCRAAGKYWGDYARLGASKAFAAALSTETGIPISELIQSLRGGDPNLQGTWVHPQVAIHLAQWASAEFAVKVSQWVFDWVTQRQKPASAMTVGELLVKNAEAFRALEIQQIETSRRLDDHDAKLAALGAHEDYRSIKAHAALIGRRLTPKQAADLGRMATALSRQRKIKIGTQPDATYGHVNLYHRDLLEEIFSIQA